MNKIMQGSSAILTMLSNRLMLVQNRQNRIDLLSNAFIFLAGTIVTATVLVITEILFEFSHTGRTVIFGTFCILIPCR